MAISFDTATETTVVNPGTSMTYAHTCGADARLFVHVVEQIGLTTGATYNGSAMTLLASQSLGGADFFTKESLYFLAAPVSGTHDVVISTSGLDVFASRSVSYLGAASGTPADVSANALVTSVTSLTGTVTSTVATCWAVGAFYNSATDTVSAGTGTTLRFLSTTSSIGFADSNGPLTPAGSKSLQVTWSPSANAAAILVALQEPVSSNTLWAASVM